MLAKNVEPPPAAFNSLIVAAQRAKQPDLVARSFQEMVNAGVTPSRETYETTLSAVSAGGMADSALEVSLFIYLFVWAIILTSCFVHSRVVTGEGRKALRDAVLALVRSRGWAGEVRRAVERLDVQADRGARGGDERNHRRAAILRRVISISLSV